MASSQTVKSDLLWSEQESKIVLSGNISIEYLPALLKKYAWQSFAVKQVDFEAVTRADSAILAVLLVWAQQANDLLKISHLPDELKTLVDLYDLEKVVVIH